MSFLKHQLQMHIHFLNLYHFMYPIIQNLPSFVEVVLFFFDVGVAKKFILFLGLVGKVESWHCSGNLRSKKTTFKWRGTHWYGNDWRVFLRSLTGLTSSAESAGFSGSDLPSCWSSVILVSSFLLLVDLAFNLCWRLAWARRMDNSKQRIPRIPA